MPIARGIITELKGWGVGLLNYKLPGVSMEKVYGRWHLAEIGSTKLVLDKSCQHKYFILLCFVAAFQKASRAGANFDCVETPSEVHATTVHCCTLL